MDTIIDVDRLPVEGEVIMSRVPDTGRSVPGGKGANQAVAVARLCAGRCRAQFITQFGNDAHAKALESSLLENGVSLSGSGWTDKPSGQGLVFLGTDGRVSSVVVGGSNMDWPEDLKALGTHIRGAAALLLQREVPERVNVECARMAQAAGVPVFQDAGGEDRAISDETLKLLDVVAPNMPELQRLTGVPVASMEDVVPATAALQARGARSVLVTLGAHGSVLVAPDGLETRQEASSVPGGTVADETGAGDSFRAAFVVALIEGLPTQEALQFASAAGAVAVSRVGAFTSLPSRADCDALLNGEGPVCAARDACSPMFNATSSAQPGAADADAMKFASRLNSMHDRQDLWAGEDSVLGWVARQGKVRGLDFVDFNYPQHFAPAGVSVAAAKAAVEAAGLNVGGIAMRFPSEFRQGAFSNPNEALRRKAIELTIEGGHAAKELGAGELVVWSPYDGYDYSLQADYHAAWQHTVEAFQEVCDAHPDLLVSLEHKPTDENTRFSVVGSAGAAKLLVLEVNRSNMGITVDVGHCLMAGENPAQSVAMLGDRLFGVHLNDGHSRIGAEDGLMLGSVHPAMTLELMYWLQRIQYRGHLYMDTFPRNEDPVRECEFNIRRAKALWAKAKKLQSLGFDAILAQHDAMSAYELLEAHGALGG